MAQWVKRLLLKHKNMSSNPQNPRTSYMPKLTSIMPAFLQHDGGKTGESPEVQDPASVQSREQQWAINKVEGMDGHQGYPDFQANRHSTHLHPTTHTAWDVCGFKTQ